MVWRWQRRYAEAGVDGLLCDKTRPPGKKPVPIETVKKVLALTCGEPPGEMTHWTGRAMAKTVGLSLNTVQRIWKANRLQPHRLRTFKRSTDPALAEKVEDIVGLYMHPPAHAVVLSIDEKSQIQALDRTQPGLPIKRGQAGTMTHDYIRNGTTTLFAALNVFDGTVIGQCMARHRHQEFIRFLNRIEAAVPAGRLIHAILDNYAAHKHPKVRAWLVRHPRWIFHFVFLGQSGRRLLCHTDPAPFTARRLPLARRPAGRNQPLSRRAQPQTQTLCLDRRPQPHHRKGQSWISSVGVRPLAGSVDAWLKSGA